MQSTGPVMFYVEAKKQNGEKEEKRKGRAKQFTRV
jgi:hypothetical protein